MKTKILCLLLASTLLALAAWFVRTPAPAQADEIPEKYRETVSKGLEYLVKNQCDDGHWEGDKGQHPVAMTGLVGIALLMESNNPRNHQVIRENDGFPSVLSSPVVNSKYASNIRKATDWLMAQSQAGRDGLIFSEHPSETTRYMEGHGLATLFLAGVAKTEIDGARRVKVAEVLDRAVKYIVKAQSSRGGWYHTSKVEGHDFDDFSVTALQIQALQAAENAGINVPRGVISDAQEYLKGALAKGEGTAKGEPNASRVADTAAALACRRLLDRFGQKQQDSLSKEWLKICQKAIPVSGAIQFGRDELTHYYYAQAVFAVNGEAWATYRTALFDHLQSSQNKDGSWPTSEGFSVGQVYATALWSIVLQLDKRSHPSLPNPVVFDDIAITGKREPGPVVRFAMNTLVVTPTQVLWDRGQGLYSSLGAVQNHVKFSSYAVVSMA